MLKVTIPHLKLEKYQFFILFFLAFAFRLLYLFYLELDNPIRGDAISYIQYANNLYEYGVFSKDSGSTPVPDSFWAPGYPFFIVFLLFFCDLFGADLVSAVCILQALMSAVTVALTFNIAMSFLSFRYATLAALLTLFCPHLITISGNILSETLFTFLLTFSVWFLIVGMRQKKSVYFCCIGFFFGLCYMVNPVVASGFATLIFAMALTRKYALIDSRDVVFSVVFFVLTIAPWELRSAVFLDNNGATSSDRAFINFVIGTHPDFHKQWRMNFRGEKNPVHQDLAASKGDLNTFLKLFWNRVEQDPSKYVVWYSIGKPLALWQWSVMTGQGDIYVFPVKDSLYYSVRFAAYTSALMWIFHYPLLFLALYGLVYALCFRRSEKNYLPLFLGAMVVGVSGVYILLQAETRYSVPLRPEMYILAMYGLKRLLLCLNNGNLQFFRARVSENHSIE